MWSWGTWRREIAEEDLGIKMDHKLSVRQQREAFVAENPEPELEPSLGDAFTGALQACSVISLFSSVTMKPGWRARC